MELWNMVRSYCLPPRNRVQRRSRLKWQQDTSKPLYGQRGTYSKEYRRKHRYVRTGPPTHVPVHVVVQAGSVRDEGGNLDDARGKNPPEWFRELRAPSQ